MRAAVFYGVGDIRVRSDVKEPEILKDEVLINVKAAGICGTDLHIYRGEWEVPTPIILGHEFSGVVADVEGEIEGLGLGDHVVAEPNITCGRCWYCRMSERNYFCENLKATGVTVDGAFADYVKVPVRNVYKIPDELPFDEAALIEPLACCIRGIDRAGIRVGDRVAIVGAGPIGLILLQLARSAGASMVIQTDLRDERLEMAESLGADYTININREDPVEAVKELTGGYGVDVAIEAVGKPEAITQAMRLLRRGGRLNIFGVSPQDAVWSVKPFELYEMEMTITTSYRSPFTFQRAVEMASSGKLRLGKLITHRFRLEEIVEAFRVAGGAVGGAVKVVIEI